VKYKIDSSRRKRDRIQIVNALKKFMHESRWNVDARKRVLMIMDVLARNAIIRIRIIAGMQQPGR